MNKKKEENGKRDYFWGHYTLHATKATKDFVKRISDTLDLEAENLDLEAKTVDKLIEEVSRCILPNIKSKMNEAQKNPRQGEDKKSREERSDQSER